jgi:hypothetical protein
MLQDAASTSAVSCRYLAARAENWSLDPATGEGLTTSAGFLPLAPE